jgi:hypothetical protein
MSFRRSTKAARRSDFGFLPETQHEQIRTIWRYYSYSAFAGRQSMTSGRRTALEGPEIET